MFGKLPENARVAVAIHKGNQPDALKLLEAVSAAAPDHAEGKPAVIQKNGRTVHPLGEDGAYWFEKDDLILTTKNAVDSLLAVIEGKAEQDQPPAPAGTQEDGK